MPHDRSSPPPAASSRDSPAWRPNEALRGMLLLVASTVVFSGSDAAAKFLGESLPAAEIAWIRYVVFVLATLLPLARGRSIPRARRPILQVLRGLATVGSALLFILGLQHLPLAEASAISYVSPLLITALSAPILKETVGPRRWAAVAAGMLGVLIVVRPGTAAFQPAALFPFSSASCWALALVLTRKTASSDPPATTLLWSAVSGLLILSAMQPFGFVVPGPRDLALGILIGVLATTGQWLLVRAFQLAPASLLAPFSYVQLVWAAMLGYAVFGAWPDRWTLAGAVFITASGLYTAHRERVRGRAGPAPLAAAPAAGEASGPAPRPGRATGLAGATAAPVER